MSSDWDEIDWEDKSGLIAFRELKMRNFFLKNIETITLFRKEINENFKKINERQDEYFKLIFDAIERFEERNKSFVEKLEERHRSFEARIEKIDKNIESLLKILIQKS